MTADPATDPATGDPASGDPATGDPATEAEVEQGHDPGETGRDPTTDQHVVHVDRDGYLDLVKSLADDGYVMCVDLTAVDYLGHAGRAVPEGVTAERFEVVVNLLDLAARRRVRLRIQVPEADPVVDSLFDVHPGAEALEREVYDMFGISFAGHPDLTRILMPEDWEGHPLRKDYDVGRIPVQFKDAPA